MTLRCGHAASDAEDMTGDTTTVVIGLCIAVVTMLVALALFAVYAARVEAGYRRYSAARAAAVRPSAPGDLSLPTPRTSAEESVVGPPTAVVERSTLSSAG